VIKQIRGEKSFFALFEGGGAKGLAYAGALRACAKFGLRFEGACGVSAGSIAAAFVAAQMSPFHVAKLLSVPIPDILRSGQGSLLKRSFRATGRMIRMEGLKTSAGIEHWVDEQLRIALGLNRTVCFSDLRRPLAILAYDTTDGAPKIWSRSSTPEAEVALAVRSSCSIPMVFSSVDVGLASYVDGGVLDNLPLFLIEELSKQIELPTIAFRLKNSETVIDPNIRAGLKEKAAGSIGRAIDARTALPGYKDVDLKTVVIDCGNIGTTDFGLSNVAKRALMRRGAKAVRACLSSTVVSQNTAYVDGQVDAEQRRISKQRHATLARTGRLIAGSTKQVNVIGGDISWLEELAPHLLLAAERGVEVRLLTAKASSTEVRRAQRLGIKVRSPSELDVGKLRCTIVDPGEPSSEVLLVEKEHMHSPLIYSASEAPGLLSHLGQSFERLWSAATPWPLESPCLRALSSEDIISALQRVRQYANSEISIEELRPTQVLPACAYVETFKLDRLQRVAELYVAHKAEFGYHIEGTPWYSILPVVERRPGGKLVVIDGTHRFYSAYLAHRAVRCFVVSCGDELPSKPMQDWSLVQLTTAKLPRPLRFNGFNQHHFRHIKAMLASEFSDFTKAQLGP
jgi:NTE family protein